MPNYALLKTKIQTDHPTDTPEQIRDALNTKNIAVRVPISRLKIERYLFVNGLWRGIADSTSPAAKNAIDGLSRFDPFDVSDPTIDATLAAVMDDLIAASLTPAFTLEHKTAIMAMGDAMESWADQNWSGDVTLWDIQEATK